jgi:DNA primase
MLSLSASLLQVSPALFGRERSQKNMKSHFAEQKEDPAWQSILKTFMEKEYLLSDAMRFISPGMAGMYHEAFEMLMKGKNDHPSLRRIAIDETISAMDEDEFWRALKVQIKIYYRKCLQSLTKNSDVSYAQKSYTIRKIKSDILPRLEKGELVPYESDITF